MDALEQDLFIACLAKPYMRMDSILVQLSFKFQASDLEVECVAVFRARPTKLITFLTFIFFQKKRVTRPEVFRPDRIDIGT